MCNKYYGLRSKNGIFLECSPTRVTRLKVAQNMADPISIKDSRQYP